MVREDFDFYSGQQSISADDDGVFGGHVLPEGWSTARGFGHGDGLREFARIYEGLFSLITVTGADSETETYPDAYITENVNGISEENCKAVSFVFADGGYTLTFDYTTLTKSFVVTARAPGDNARLQAFGFLNSACQYLLFGSYPELWPSTGHLPWADKGVDEMEYLNDRNETMDQDERVFMYEKAEAYLEEYGIPMVPEEQRAFLSSLSDSDRDMFEACGLKIWGWVQANTIYG